MYLAVPLLPATCLYHSFSPKIVSFPKIVKPRNWHHVSFLLTNRKCNYIVILFCKFVHIVLLTIPKIAHSFIYIHIYIWNVYNNVWKTIPCWVKHLLLATLLPIMVYFYLNFIARNHTTIMTNQAFNPYSDLITDLFFFSSGTPYTIEN